MGKERSAAVAHLASAENSPDELRAAPSLLWPLAVVAAVLYGSWIPFRVDHRRWLSAELFGLGAFTWIPTNLEDLVTNLLIYLPVGFAVAAYFLLLFRRSPMDRSAPIRVVGCLIVIPATVVGFTVSLLAEWVQVAIPSRQASWIDVLLNTLSAFLGGVAALILVPRFHALIGRLRRAFRVRPCTCIAMFVAAGILLASLAPFDFVRNTSELHRSLLRSGRSLQTFLSPTPQPDPAHDLALVMSFAALAYFTALARRERGERPQKALFSTAVHIAGFALMIELGNIFSRSKAIEWVTILLSTVAATLGSWLAIALVDAKTDSNWRRQRPLIAPTILLAAFALLQIGLLAAPFAWSHSHISLSPRIDAVQWLPFHALWHRPMLIAANYAAETILFFGLFSFALTTMIQRMKFPGTAWMVAGITVSLAAAVELGQAATGLGTPDITVAILALFAATLALKFHRHVFSSRSWQPVSIRSINPGQVDPDDAPRYAPVAR